MSARTGMPPFPRPLLEEPHRVQTEERIAADERDGTWSAYGYCKDFCVIDSDGTERRRGHAVAAHGPACRSVGVLSVDGIDVDGAEAHVYGELVRSYKHGVYPREVLQRGLETTFVSLGVMADGVTPDPDDGETKAILIRPSEARSMAAALVRLADVAEGLTTRLGA